MVQKTNLSSFEPRDEQKGATARAMLYMITRYGNCTGFLNGQETVLRDWANTHEPSAFEIARNEAILRNRRTEIRLSMHLSL